MRNAEAVSLDRLPLLDAAELVAAADEAIGGGERLAAFFALPGAAGEPELLALLVHHPHLRYPDRPVHTDLVLLGRYVAPCSRRA